jgi:SAM-dependent methyltransferase
VEPGVAELASRLVKASHARTLDFGCGTGRHLVYLARMGFEVFGFDWSGASIEVAKRELAKHKLGAALRVWDMNDPPLPYDDSFFDAVIAVRVLHHIYADKIKRIANEIQRITRTGGFLYLEVPTHEKAMRQKLEGADSEEPEPGTFVPSQGDEAGIPHHHFTKEELRSLFPNFTPESIGEANEHYCLTAIRV